MQVDHVLLSHDNVAEAVAFAEPDELLGEVVAAVVVLKEARDGHDHAAAIRSFLSTRLSKEKVNPCLTSASRKKRNFQPGLETFIGPSTWI